MLLGRLAERQRISALLDAARAGGSGVLAFVGEPGIGKTALLAHAAGEATDFTVLRVRGVESESHIPFASLLELCRPALGAIKTIPEPQATALECALALRPAQPGERFAVGAAVLSLLGATAEDRPLLVLVDDAHWLDPSSGEALRFAVRRLVADGIAVLVAVREEEASFIDGSDLPQWHLGGLSPSEAAMLLAQTGLPPELTERAVAATGGNPLALLELGQHVDIAALARGGRPVVPVPAVLAQGFLRRVQSLDPDARRLLLVAAVNDGGDAVALDQAARQLGIDVGAIVRAETAGVLVLDQGGVEFCQPLVRAAVYASGPADLRRSAHRALAAVLSDRDVDRRAWHLAAAAVGTDPTAADALRQAGERARARSAYAVAASAFERAATLTADENERADHLWEAAQSAWRAGLNEKVEELLAAARAVTGGGDRAVALTHLEGQVALHRGAVMDGYALLSGAADDADADRAVEMLADASLACFFAGRPSEMLATAMKASGRLSAQSSGRARYLASMSMGMALILGGDAAAGADMIRCAANLLNPEDIPDDPRAIAWMVMGPMWLRDRVAARAVVDRALEAARLRSAVGTLPFLLSYLARDQAGGESWPAATACYDESIRVSRETGQRSHLAVALAGLAWLEARQGRDERCRAHVAEANALCRQLELDFFGTWILAALGDLELGRGNAAAAAEHYRGQPELLAERGITDPDISPVPELVEAALRLGQRHVAEQLAVPFAVSARRKGQPWSCARASRALGMVATDAEFDAYFEQAMLAHRETPDSFEVARTLLAHGARLRRARRRTEAREPLRAAFETFERLGARPWAEASRAELAATGETIRSRGEGALDQLTPQELQIALLLASGKTTREAAAALFVSPKTIEYHLRHVYQKLDVRTRDALAQALGSSANGRPG